MEIIFDNRQDFLKVDKKLFEKIESVMEACLMYEGYEDDYDVSLSFVNNNEIRELNKNFRGIDKATDVLSFPLLTEDDSHVEFEEYSLGDIVISTEKAQEQAEEFGHSLEREICFLVCHSMFHLLGYDHMEEEEAIEMHGKERDLLNRLGITRDI
ncbi:rRNA maturation RNase YbeY [Peptostreptococcus equinus]|uniref:Endoribonuclease YbeY n=1 Tax=Peptostreptococcus equinus TaxID=3003601 RepID=A0ABY7JLZ5_9FIRM|nr:rRNA maturation RNase YbeY [Peptostreptococcus sp. CBA3647]WAW14179.1 rRNA maturation RNase YbeY [Peptostreptococcus sp. CBA3647]